MLPVHFFTGSCSSDHRTRRNIDLLARVGIYDPLALSAGICGRRLAQADIGKKTKEALPDWFNNVVIQPSSKGAKLAGS
jgi:hypothetical protein